MMMRASSWSACSATAICLFLVGCGGGAADRVPVFETSGTITLGGEPLASAVVTFAPLDGQPRAFARTGSDGKYQLSTYGGNDGAAAGNFAIVVTKYVEKTAPATSDAAHGTDTTKDYGGGHSAKAENDGFTNAVPALYTKAETTPETREVKPDGPNVFDIQIP